MPVVKLNGIELSYRDHGTGPLVVMIMGSGSSGRVWELHQVPALVAAGFRAVTLDNRGIPPSEEHPPSLTIDDLVADTAALIRHLGPPAAVVGTSMGARVGQELALAHPDLVGCAVLLATHGRVGPVQQAWSLGTRELHDRGMELPAALRAAVAAGHNLSPRTLEDPARAAYWLDLFAAAPARLAPGARAHLGLSDGVDRVSAYRGITVASLVVGFADDQVLPAALAREVAEAIPGARFELVADCGHLGYLERPDEVNRLILQFLAGWNGQTYEPPTPQAAPEEETTMAVNPFDDDDGEFFVVVNHEGQHSLWPTFLTIPTGWETVRAAGSRQDCVDWVDAQWTDQRPRSLVEATESAQQGAP